jgi:hypothetical protein
MVLCFRLSALFFKDKVFGCEVFQSLANKKEGNLFVRKIEPSGLYEGFLMKDL